ncbi:uncharacterized protein LOC118143628 isoform X3 [Callithrix jacchus]
MAPCNPGLQPPSVALLLFADTAPGEDTRDSVLPDSSPAGGALRPLLGVKVAERQDGAGRRFNTHRRGDGRAAEEAEIGHKTKAAGSSQKLLQARTLLQPSDSCDPASTLIRAQ